MYLGIQREDGLTLGIDELPGKKRLYLVARQGNKEKVYTSFANDDNAVEFISLVAEFVGLKLE